MYTQLSGWTLSIRTPIRRYPVIVMESFCPALVGWLRQSVFGRLAGYEDVNAAERFTTIRRRAGFSAPVQESSREYWLI